MHNEHDIKINGGGDCTAGRVENVLSRIAKLDDGQKIEILRFLKDNAKVSQP